MLTVKNLKAVFNLSKETTFNKRTNQVSGVWFDSRAKALYITDGAAMFMLPVECVNARHSEHMQRVLFKDFKELMQDQDPAAPVSVEGNMLCIGGKKTFLFSTDWQRFSITMGMAGKGENYAFYDPEYILLIKKALQSFGSSLDDDSVYFCPGDSKGALRVISEDFEAVVMPLRVTKKTVKGE